jgi:hypothetical protein
MDALSKLKQQSQDIISCDCCFLAISHLIRYISAVFEQPLICSNENYGLLIL